MQPPQFSLFDAGPTLPEGLVYRSAFISTKDEAMLAERIAALPLKAFEFHGFLGRRRVISFGWHYDFKAGSLRKTEPMPDFLLPARDAAAAFAGLGRDALEHVLLTEYAPGAGIGWHRDRRAFGEVVGISLLSACRLRFRRKSGSKWERMALLAEPRSAYLLSGASRNEWEHSIAPIDALRYSITFRSFAD